MTTYDIYIFLLCLLVFTLLTGLLITMLVSITKLTVRVIRHGGEDKSILAEYYKSLKKKKKQAQGGGILCKIFSTIVFCALFAVFSFSVYTNIVEKNGGSADFVPRVVKSASMQTKNEKNRYLFENHLDNQFATFDLIITRKLPAESELKLYDIVVYEKDGLLLVHRIVGIEEPNEKHPDERYFLLQGDAVSTPDVFPVKYSQMRGIYRNERIPFLGSFVWFMQSPAGYLCILLVVFAIICSPLMDKKVEKARAERLAILLAQLQSKAAYEQVQKARTTKQSPYGVPAPIPVKGTIAGYIKLLPVPPGMQVVDLAELEKQYK